MATLSMLLLVVFLFGAPSADGVCRTPSDVAVCKPCGSCPAFGGPDKTCPEVVRLVGCKGATDMGCCQCQCPDQPYSKRTGTCSGENGECYGILAGWQEESVLSAHNKFRAQHGLCPMTYDRRIASIVANSEGLKQTCTSGKLTHNTGLELDGVPLGENLMYSPGGVDMANYDPASAAHVWYCTEEGCFDYTNRANNNQHDVGHFTQVVLDGAHRVGCAMCSKGDGQYFDIFVLCGYITAQFGNEEIRPVGSPPKTCNGSTAAPNTPELPSCNGLSLFASQTAAALLDEESCNAANLKKWCVYDGPDKRCVNVDFECTGYNAGGKTWTFRRGHCPYAENEDGSSVTVSVAILALVLLSLL